MAVAEDTLVVYTSDQGYFLGEHNGFDKRYMWDESIRVPVALRYPREIQAGTLLGAGTLISNVDWAPTILDFAQVKIEGLPRFYLGTNKDPIGFEPFATRVLPTSNQATLLDGVSPFWSGLVSNGSEINNDDDRGPLMEPEGVAFHGSSFRPLLLQGSEAVLAQRSWPRDSIYYRYYGDPSRPLIRPGHVGIRTRDGFKVILYYDLRCYPELWKTWTNGKHPATPSTDAAEIPPAGPWELYDLRGDPKETTNAFERLRRTNSSLVTSLQRLLAVEMLREGFEPGIVQYQENGILSATLNEERQRKRLESSGRSKKIVRGFPQECLSLGFETKKFIACLQDGCPEGQ